MLNWPWVYSRGVVVQSVYGPWMASVDGQCIATTRQNACKNNLTEHIMIARVVSVVSGSMKLEDIEMTPKLGFDMAKAMY